MTDLEYLKKYGDLADENVEKLNKGIPVQYIVGNVDFCGNIINVNSNVLIPRFETEELVSKTYKYLKGKSNLDIVDLGTGSGCISISLKKLLNCNMDAVDISYLALEVALDNSKKNNVDINFYLGNMLEPLNKKYDCIISNPPYIAHDEEIMDIVNKNEPHLALYADNDGLYFYEEILKNCSKYLKNDALIAFEIGYKQGLKIKALAHKYLNSPEVIIEKDLSDKDRFVFIKVRNNKVVK